MAKIKVPTSHIAAKKGEIAETILLPGDPLRAKYIAETYLKDVKQFNDIRNMFGYTGIYKGKRVSVMGTGMGCPSMGIYSYELIHFYGCKNLIRVGTAGSLHSDVKAHDLVFALASCTDSRYPSLMGQPGQFAPVCSYELLEKAVEAAKKKGYRYHVGNLFCTDMLYGNKALGPDGYRKLGCIAADMESAALYTNANVAGVNALTIVSISDAADKKVSAKERETAFTNMMEVALTVAYKYE